jgi:hypothetical protein
MHIVRKPTACKQAKDGKPFSPPLTHEWGPPALITPAARLVPFRAVRMSYPVLPESSRDADENWKSEMPIIDQTRYLSRRNCGQLNHLQTHTQRLHLSDAGFGTK